MTDDTPRARTVKRATLVAALGLGIAPFVADAIHAGRVPDDRGVATATAAIRDGFEDGDAVYVTPTWYTLPWHALEDMGPGTERWPYPALLMSEDIDPLEALAHARLWVLAGFGREPVVPPILADVATNRFDVPIDGNGVALARWDLPRVERLHTMSVDRADLEVRRGPEGALTECRFRGDRHRCGRDGYLDLHLEDRIVGHHQVQWLMAHPSPDHGLLEIDWKDLPASGTWLYVRAGWTMEAVRHPEGSEAHLVVLVDGREVDHLVLDPRRYVLERRAIHLVGAEPTATVTVRIWADDIGYRELMLEADVLADLPAPLRAWATAVVE